jgi:histidyl-tRNA synthetase
MLTQAPRGTKDVLPKESGRWQALEQIMRENAARAGYREVRTPVFEHTELFLRGVGDTTDIVQKEMYTFKDKGDRSITLKPEGTAGVVRALIEHSLYADVLPCKTYYLNAPIFRYVRRSRGGFGSTTSSAWNASVRKARRWTRRSLRWHSACWRVWASPT